MADHDQAALVALEELAQPRDRVRVEVVGGLVEEHRVGAGEQDARELDAAALAAGEGAERLVEDPVGQAQVARDGRGLRLGRVPAERDEALLEPAVVLHRLRGDLVVRGRHVEHRALHVERQRAEAAGVEDARTRQVLGVAGARVLREVADLAGAVDAAAGGLALSREDLGERGLAGAVAADEADLVPRAHPERDVLHEDAGADAQLQLVYSEHGERSSDQRMSHGPWERGDPQQRGSSPVGRGRPADPTGPVYETQGRQPLPTTAGRRDDGPTRSGWGRRRRAVGRMITWRSRAPASCRGRRP